MKYTKFITAVLAVGAFAIGVHAADPPAAATYRALDDKLYVLGTDNDFQITYDSGDNRVEIRDAAGNVLGRVSDAGTTGVIGFVQHDVINGSVASQITSGATSNRAVTLPDAAGEISLLGQTIATGEIVDGTIANADVSASAAIAATKLNAGTNGQAIVTAGGVSGWGTVPSAGITDDTIVNADINSAAAIAITKLSSVGASADYVLTYNGSAIVWAANAGGSIEGAGPLVDGAIPRMDGTGGDTLQGYSSNTITASDAGLLTVPGGMLVQDDMEIEAASILLSDSADLYFARDDEIRWDILYTTGSETGVSGETSLAFDAYDNDGNFLRRALQLNRTASEGVVIGTVSAPSPLYVKGDIYAHTSDAQIVDDGKVLLSAIAQTSATTGQVLQWNGSTWAPASSSVNWGSPGEIGSVTPNVGSFTTLYASSLDLSTPLPDAEVADTLTIGASSTVADGALSANVAHVNAVETIASDWVNTANPWADNEVSDTLTASVFKGSGTSTDAIDLATAEVAGTLDSANIDQSLSVATLAASGAGTFANITAAQSGGSQITARRTNNFAGSTTGGYYIEGVNSTPANVVYAQILGQSDAITAGAENGSLLFYTRKTGAVTLGATLDSNALWTMVGGVSVGGNTTIGDAAADTEHHNANTITYEGATANAHELIFSITDPTADRTMTFPDRDGITAFTTNVLSMSAADFTPCASPTGLYNACTANATISNWVVNGLACADGNREAMVGQGIIPPDYNGGTIQVTVYWVANSASTNSTVWGVLFDTTGVGKVVTGIGYADPDVTHITSANGGTGKCNAAVFTTTAPTNPEAAVPFSIFIGRVGDDASDNLAATAYVIGAKITYTRK